jgi:hypothetical protein
MQEMNKLLHIFGSFTIKEKRPVVENGFEVFIKALILPQFHPSISFQQG